MSSDTDYGTAATDAFVQAILARNNRTTASALCLSKRFVLYDNATDEDAEQVVKVSINLASTSIVCVYVCVCEHVGVHLCEAMNVSYQLLLILFLVK